MPLIQIKDEAAHKQLKLLCVENGITLGEGCTKILQIGLRIGLLDLDSNDLSKLMEIGKIEGNSTLPALIGYWKVNQ